MSERELGLFSFYLCIQFGMAIWDMDTKFEKFGLECFARGFLCVLASRLVLPWLTVLRDATSVKRLVCAPGTGYLPAL